MNHICAPSPLTSNRREASGKGCRCAVRCRALQRVRSSAAAHQGGAARGQQRGLTRDAPRQAALAGYQETFSALLRVRRAALLLDELWRDLMQAAGAQMSITASFRLSCADAGLRVRIAAVL